MEAYDLLSTVLWSNRPGFTIKANRYVRRVVSLGKVVRTIRAYRPDLSVFSRAVVEAALLAGGSIGTAREVAPHLGFRNRFELARLLKRERLPPLHDLAGWASVLAWLERAECSGCSLCHIAFRERKDPATCYRTVKRITGLRWRQLRMRGSAWAVERFCGVLRGTACAEAPGSPVRCMKPVRNGARSSSRRGPLAARAADCW